MRSFGNRGEDVSKHLKSQQETPEAEDTQQGDKSYAKTVKDLNDPGLWPRSQWSDSVSD